MNENEAKACRKFVRHVSKCTDCLHVQECLAVGHPVGTKFKGYAQFNGLVERLNKHVNDHVLPEINGWLQSATAACRQSISAKHRFVLVIAFSDRTYDYLQFDEMPKYADFERLADVLIYGHYGKDITNDGK